MAENVATPGTRSAEVDAYLAGNAAEFMRPAQARLALIVVHSAAEVSKVKSELAGGTPFGEVARMLAGGSKGSRSGEAAWRSESSVPAEVWEAAAGARLERNCGPVSTAWGSYFLRVEARRPAGRPDREELRDMARRKVAAQKRREAVENYVASLRAAATIRVDMRALDRL
jgi:parvulin-like peptidyl-prolyl isomerase